MATLNVRNLDDDTYRRLKAAGRLRGMTAAQYIAALVRLHDAIRAIADHVETDTGAQLQTELRALGLETVTG